MEADEALNREPQSKIPFHSITHRQLDAGGQPCHRTNGQPSGRRYRIRPRRQRR